MLIELQGNTIELVSQEVIAEETNRAMAIPNLDSRPVTDHALDRATAS